MKKKTIHKGLFLVLIFSIISLEANSQTIEQDPKIEALLKEKRRISTDLTIGNLFKIQIYIGKIDDSKRILNKFLNIFKEIEGTIVYNNPTYKVWVGGFETRIEAEKAMIDIKKKYPLALLIKPNK